MNHLLKNKKQILFSLIAGFALGLFVKKAYITLSKKPFYWNTPPIVVNCTRGELDRSVLRHATKFWEENGEKFLFYEYDYIEEVCENKNEFVEGFIILRNEYSLHARPIENNVLATTATKTDLVSIQSASITFKEGTHNYYLLLAHELGHSLGYKHKKKRGNIMHPFYDFMGSNI